AGSRSSSRVRSRPRRSAAATSVSRPSAHRNAGNEADEVRVRNMTLQVVGAGLGRTGTHSLKAALEQLLGGPCYHMVEVFGRPDHVPMWRDAALGQPVDWDALFEGYVATVDWPGASVWKQIADHYPDAVVL